MTKLPGPKWTLRPKAEGYMKGIVSAVGNLRFGSRACVVLMMGATTTTALHAQNFALLHSFDGTDGYGPLGTLVQATDGDLFGTTQYGGVAWAGGNLAFGTVFKLSPEGKLTTLYSFCPPNGGIDCPSGDLTAGGLVQAIDGDLYGTNSQGGTFFPNVGTIFKITLSGTLTPLYAFCANKGGACTDGASPYAGLVQATNGDLYGTTEFGGVNTCPGPTGGCGTIFKITPSGILTTLYSFCAQRECADGYFPEAGLIQAANGDLYGTTYAGGASESDG